jgi:hypothetical protein
MPRVLALLSFLLLSSAGLAAGPYGIDGLGSGGPDRGPFPSEWVAGAPGAPGLSDPHVRAAWGLLEKELDPCEYTDPQPRAGRVTGERSEEDFPQVAWRIVVLDFEHHAGLATSGEIEGDGCWVDRADRLRARAAVRIPMHEAEPELVR